MFSKSGSTRKVVTIIVAVSVCLIMTLIIMQPDNVTHANTSVSLKLPWKQGENWLFTQGPHARGNSCGEPRSALDFQPPNGSFKEILAAANGYVKRIGNDTTSGNYIIIEHASDLFTFYGHLSEYRVSQGDSVLQGQLIGIAGNTGQSGGVHLHFELLSNADSGAGSPRSIEGEYLSDYLVSYTGCGGNGFSNGTLTKGTESYNTAASSIPEVPSDNHIPDPGVYLCTDPNLMGQCHRFTETYLNFQDLGDLFCNDCASSVYISGNYWAILWENAFAGGRPDLGTGGWSRTFGYAGNPAGHPQKIDNLTSLGLNDGASSIFVWQDRPGTDDDPKEGVYMCPDGWFRNGNSTDPSLCYNFPPIGNCAEYDIWWWNHDGGNGASSFWVLGNYNIWIQADNPHSQQETFSHSMAELWNPSPNGNIFNDNMGKFQVIPFGQQASSTQTLLDQFLGTNTAFAQMQCTSYPAPPWVPQPPTVPAELKQWSNLVVSKNPVFVGSDNTFTFDVRNTGGQILYMNEILVQGSVPGGGIWKGWATPQNINSGETKTFVASAPMWADHLGTWSLDKITYQDNQSHFFDLPSNGYTQAQTFSVIAVDNIPPTGSFILHPSVVNDSLVLTAQVADDLSGVTWVTLHLRPQNGSFTQQPLTFNPSTQLWEGSFNTSSYPNGQLLEYLLWAGDNAGNSQQITGLFGATVDREPPTGSFVSAPTQVNQSLDVTAQAQDNLSGVAWVTLHARPQNGSFMQQPLTFNSGTQFWEGSFNTSGYAHGQVLEYLLWSGDNAGNSQQITGLFRATVVRSTPQPTTPPLPTATPVPSSNLIKNSDFEDDYSYWEHGDDPSSVKTSLDTATVHSGRQSFKITFDGSPVNYFHTNQVVSVQPNTAYLLSGYLKTQKLQSTEGVCLEVQDLRGWQYLARCTQGLTETNNWTFVTISFRSLPETTQLRIFLRRRDDDQPSKPIKGIAWFDDLKLIKLNDLMYLPLVVHNG